MTSKFFGCPARSVSVRAFVLSLTCLLAAGAGCSSNEEPERLESGGHYVSYAASIQPIFNRRCAVCHSCNDAPCQLDATAFQGIDRGACSTNVYADRLFSIDPSRLFIDAKTTKEWRDKGFFPVIRHHSPGDPRNLSESILFQLVDYRRENDLPEKAHFDAFSSRRCPNLQATLPWLRAELSTLFSSSSDADLGMPFGFPALRRSEFLAIRDWLIEGAPGPARTNAESPRLAEDRSAITAWEAFFNRENPRQKLVSRYLYEHLFLAHLYFGPVPGGERPLFYRLVRSKTEAPEPIDEIANRHPYDSPGEHFVYRFRPIESVIVHKTHLGFELSTAILDRWEASFLAPVWKIDEKRLPSYFSNEASNPFTTFAEIPARARYQFMLENSEYFVSSFMKGPVCRGQLALNVIDDHFFMFFLDPDADQSVAAPDFLKRTGKYLITPFRPEDLFARTSGSDIWSILELPIRAIEQLRRGFYPYYKGRQLKYLKRRDEFYQHARPDGFSLEDLWDGDGANLNAVLTVFRHYDSASVVKGAWGGMPKTSLVLDYPIFERMYYDLVASFDVYGDIKSQLATRLYFDDLRIEGEDVFLSFLPLEARMSVRNYWYRNAESEINGGDYPIYGTSAGTKRGSRVLFDSAHPKEELIIRILRDRIPVHAGGEADFLNAGIEGRPPALPEIRGLRDVRTALSELGGRAGAFVRTLPDLSFVRFRGEKGEKDAVFTFVRNRAHLNVKYLFDEESRLVEEEDTLSIMIGFHGSYPNFFFDVPAGRAQDFVSRLAKLGTEKADFQEFVDDFGVRRREKRFWEESDFFNDRLLEDEPLEAGLLDLNRYASF